MDYSYIIDVLMKYELVEALVKFIVIYILAGVIGLERASLSKPAGFRTHVLVGMSAVLTVICGERLSKLSGSTDFSRIPAQLLSGIGFLGAGTILRDGFNVKGLTTAASLLAITCIGLCVGSGLYITAVVATIVVYTVLRHSSALSEKIGHFHNIILHIESDRPKDVMPEVQRWLDRNKIEVHEMKLDQEASNQYIKIVGKHRDPINKNKLLSDLLAIDNVSKVLEIEEMQE